MKTFPVLACREPHLWEPIPPIVHLIWVGGQVPHWALRSMDRWMEAQAGAREVRIWTDASVALGPLKPIADLAWSLGMPPRGVADVLRTYIVSWFGGWYFDLDLIQIRPLPCDTSAMIFSDGSPGHTDWVASNGAFGFTAGHPFLAEVREIAVEALSRGVTNEHFTFGPRTFNKAIQKVPVLWEPTIDLLTSMEHRRRLAEGREFDLDELQRNHQESVVVHVAGLPEPKEVS